MFTAEYNGKLLGIPFTALLTFNTGIMVAVSLGIIMHSSAISWRDKVKSVLFMTETGKLSEALLRSGHIYYLYVRTPHERHHVNF